MKNKLFLIAMCFVFTSQMASAQVPSYVPLNGLLAYYPFIGNANELIGNTNNGTVNGATLSTDINGFTNSAYVFDGVSNYIDLPNNFYGGQTTNIVTLRLRFKVSLNGDFCIWNKDGNWLEAAIYTTLNGAFGIFWAYPNQYNGIVTTNGSLVPNIWYDAVIIVNGSNSKIYLNGTEQTAVTISTPSNSISFSSAGSCGSGINRFGYQKVSCFPTQYFNGVLDEFMLYDRVLTQQEITQLYNSDNTCQTLVINTGILTFNPPTYNNTVTIYPNPTNDQITIDCGNLTNISGWVIKIINTLGQEVFSGAMNTQQYVVPLNTWTGQGVYFVKIYDASNNLMNTKKIILQ